MKHKDQDDNAHRGTDSRGRLIRKQFGFSLVEVIIVVAIMAIAVGIAAPQLIRYIEKTQVSADVQLADAVRTSIAYAIIDVQVIEDANSQPYLNTLSDASKPHGIPINNTTIGPCLLRDRIVASLGFGLDDICDSISSEHTASTECYAKIQTSGQVIVQFTYTDSTGEKNILGQFVDNTIYVD